MRNLLIHIITGLLVFLFAYTGVSKLADHTRFIIEMNRQPLPSFLNDILVWAIPITALSISALLILDVTRLAGLYASLVLMAVFTFYTAIVLLNFFDHIPCSCGGIISTLSWPGHLVLNVFFVVLCLYGIRLCRKQKTVNISSKKFDL